LGYAKGVRGIAIPYPGTEITVRKRKMPYTRLRVDTDVQRKAGLKYENPLAKAIDEGLTYYPYVPVSVAPLRKDARKPVFITEGEKKALKMTQEGWPTIGLPGVYMFSDPQSYELPENKPLHPELARWRLRGRTVYVCFDSDRLEKDGVALAHERLCALLTRSGVVVQVVTIPALPELEKTGADDFLVRRGREEFGALVEQSRPWEPFSYLVERLPRDRPLSTLFEALVPVRRELAEASVSERRHVALRLMECYPSLQQNKAEALLTELGAPDSEQTMPEIHLDKRQLRDIVSDAWIALLESRFNERLYRYGEALVLAPEDIPSGDIRLRPVDAGVLAWLLNRSASWMRIDNDGRPYNANLPANVVKDMDAIAHRSIRPLDGLTRFPVVQADGELRKVSGYVAESRILQLLDPGVIKAMGGLPLRPSQAQQHDALVFLLEDVLGDFPFARQSDRTHALGALLLPLVRHLIAGPTPLHLLEAPTEGTGKSLLADAISIVATGRRSRPTPLSTREEELRKKLTAVLITAPSIILFDNVNHTIDSASLAAVVAAEQWNDRLLGKSKQLSLPNKAMWIVTANNPTTSREIARRTVRVRLDAGVEQPWLREKFRHPDLIGWLKKQRAEALCALLTLIRGWIGSGSPTGDVRLGTFECWSELMGGLLGSAGVEGFLSDRNEHHAVSNPEDGDWEALVAAWAEEYGLEPQPARVLMHLACERGLLDIEGGAKTRPNRARFARELGRHRDRVYAGLRITVSRDRRRKQNMYALVPVD